MVELKIRSDQESGRLLSRILTGPMKLARNHPVRYKTCVICANRCPGGWIAAKQPSQTSAISSRESFPIAFPWVQWKPQVNPSQGTQPSEELPTPEVQPEIQSEVQRRIKETLRSEPGLADVTISVKTDEGEIVLIGRATAARREQPGTPPRPWRRRSLCDRSLSPVPAPFR